MDYFTLYRDLADVMTVVSEDGRGRPGAYWSSGLFFTDAWAISRRKRTELSRATAEWARRLEWPESIARWSRTTGKLIVLDDSPGHRAERYLGMVYDASRWMDLSPDAFAVAVRAATSCTLTTPTAVQALLNADTNQLASLSTSALCVLDMHEDARVRHVVGRIGSPPRGRTVAR